MVPKMDAAKKLKTSQDIFFRLRQLGKSFDPLGRVFNFQQNIHPCQYSIRQLNYIFQKIPSYRFTVMHCCSCCTGALRSSQELSGTLRNPQELTGALRSSDVPK